MVQGRVRVAADREIIIPGGQDIALRVRIVIAREQVLVHGDHKVFGSAGLEDAGLPESHELDGGFLDLPRFFVVPVRGARVELHGTFARGAAGVLHPHRHGINMVPSLSDVRDLFGEVRVGKAVAEGIAHFPRVFPAAVKRGTDGRSRARVPHHGVRVAGLIVLVPDVNALLLHADVRRGLRVVRDDPGGIVSRVPEVRPLGGIPGGVHDGRGRQRIRGKCVHQPAGGVRPVLRGQEVHDAGKAGQADRADVHARVHGVLLDPPELQRVGRVDQDNDFPEALLRNKVHHGLLVRLQRKGIHHFRIRLELPVPAVGGHVPGLVDAHVRAFSGAPLDDHDRDVLIAIEGAGIRFIEGDRLFELVGEPGLVGAFPGGIGVDQRGIDGEPGVLHGLLEVHDPLRVVVGDARTGGRCPVQRAVNRTPDQGYVFLGGGVQRKRGLPVHHAVFQQHRPFLGFQYRLRFRSRFKRLQVLRGDRPEIRLEVFRILLDIGRLLHDAGLDPERGIDDMRVLGQDHIREHGKYRQRREQSGQAAPYACVFHLCSFPGRISHLRNGRIRDSPTWAARSGPRPWSGRSCPPWAPPR